MLKIGDFSRLTQVPITTLRYYDEMGLLKPVEIDSFTGYRYYSLDQLPRLNQILVLKDLGFSLEHIAHMLSAGLNADEIRGMLRLKRMELQQDVEAAQARLTRLEIRLRQIELEDKMPTYEILTKPVEAQRVLSIRQIVPTTGEIPQLFDDVSAGVRLHRVKAAAPWIVMYHHAGYRDVDLDVEVAIPVDASTQAGIAFDDARQMTLRTIQPIETAVTAVLKGSYDQLGEVYGALSAYIHAHGLNYLGPAREIYLSGPHDTDDAAEYLTEIQYPVGKFKEDLLIDGVSIPADWGDADTVQGQGLPFSRRARTALELAKQEALALGQAAVSPLHLLLGLFRESDSFAAHVLESFGMSVEQVRSAAPHGDSRMIQPVIADAARLAVSLAFSEARALGHSYIGTEHLLLALVWQADDLVMRVISANGANGEQVRAAVLQTLQR